MMEILTFDRLFTQWHKFLLRFTCYKSATWISNLKGYQFCVSVGHFCCAISTSYDLLSKRGFCFCLWRCSTAVATVVSRVLCCYVHIPQLLTVKPVLVNRVVFRIARVCPTRLLMAVKDKYTRIKCSCQIKKKKAMFSMWVEILSEWVFHFHGLSKNVHMKIEEVSRENDSEWKKKNTSSEIISIQWKSR